MDLNFAQNWPVFLFLAIYLTFIISAAINSRKQEKKNKESQNKEKTKDKDEK